MIFDPFKDFDTFNSHFVQPNWVNPFIKEDGTNVNGYWRDGDGDTSHDLDVNHGGGYIEHNPTHQIDHDIFHHLFH